MGSYQPGLKGQPSPIKWQAAIRSPSPFEYSSEETAYAELKSSLMMMCARKSDSRVLTDAWATRNMKAASMANAGQAKKVPTPGNKQLKLIERNTAKAKRRESSNLVEIPYESSTKALPVHTTSVPQKSISYKDTVPGHKRNDSNGKAGKKEQGKTLHLGKSAGRTTNQIRAGKKMVKTMHEERSVEENARKGHEISASADMKKVIAFLQSPSSSREKGKDPSPDHVVEWTTSKGKIDSENYSGNSSTGKNQSHTDRTIPAAFMKRSKANNIVTHARTFEGSHNNTVTCLCTSEGMLWSGSKDRSIAVWDYNKKSQGAISLVRSHTGSIISMCEIPMSGLVATSSEDQHVKIWGSLNKVPLGSFKTKNALVNCLIAKDPTQILCGSSNHRIIVL